MWILDEFRAAANGLGYHPQDHGWRDLYRLFGHGLDRSAPNLTATVLEQHGARPTLSPTHLLTLLGIAIKAVAPEPFEAIAIDSPIDWRLGVLEDLLDQHQGGIAQIILTRQNSFTSARRFLVPQVLLSSYFARQGDLEARFADFGTGLGALPRQLNSFGQYMEFADDLIWPNGVPAFRAIPLAVRLGVDRGPLPDLGWVRACYGKSEYYANLYSELLWAAEAPDVKDADVEYREIDLLDFQAITGFIRQYRINAANLTYVLYELEREKRSAIVENISRALCPPGFLLVSEPHRELQSQGAVVEFFQGGDIIPKNLCFITDGHYKGHVIPLEDYESFTRDYPIEYKLEGSGTSDEVGAQRAGESCWCSHLFTPIPRAAVASRAGRGGRIGSRACHEPLFSRVQERYN